MTRARRRQYTRSATLHNAPVPGEYVLVLSGRTAPLPPSSPNEPDAADRRRPTPNMAGGELLALFGFRAVRPGYEFPPEMRLRSRYKLIGQSVNVHVIGCVLTWLLRRDGVGGGGGGGGGGDGGGGGGTSTSHDTATLSLPPQEEQREREEGDCEEAAPPAT